MKTFKETLAALKRRVGDNTDPVPYDEALSKVAQKLGLSKEALMSLITTPLRWGASGLARGVNSLAGAVVAHPFQALEAGMIGHMGVGQAGEYGRLINPKFPRKPRGIGIHD